MPTKKQVEDILRDCIAADPSLRERQDELRQIISTMLESKPETLFSKDFANRLRAMLSEERQKRTSKIRSKPSFFDFMKLKPFALPLAGSLALVAVFAVLLTQKPMGTKTQTLATAMKTVTPGMKISKVAAGAFGTLTSTTAVAVQAPMADGLEAGRPSGAPASGAAAMAPTVLSAPDAAPSAGHVGGVTSKMAAMMPIQEPLNYRYVYKGELPAIDPSIDVFRHVKGLPSGGMLSSIGSVTAGLIDGSRFSSGTIQSLNVVEDREFGYMISLDAVEGAISLNQNWQRWPHPESKCRDEACYKQYQLTPEQVPADDAVIGIAEDFIKEFGIDRSALGQPTLNNDWRIRPMGAAADMPIYVPDVVSVTYPLLIGGKPAQDENGSPNGVTINVNVREKKVDGLWGLSTNRYEQSSYAAETDTGRLLKFVAGGGLYAGYVDPSAKTIDIELGAPEIVLTSYWKDNGDGTGQNLFVPALRFPVQNPPADQPWFRKAVTVPLSKDLLDQADAQAAQQGNGGTPTPIMYMKGGVK
jgi:hypothetical protein